MPRFSRRFLHANDIAHRDIKPANIGICKDRTMILDLGCCNFVQGSENSVSDIVGTPFYMAPEMVRDVLDNDGLPTR